MAKGGKRSPPSCPNESIEMPSTVPFEIVTVGPLLLDPPLFLATISVESKEIAGRASVREARERREIGSSILIQVWRLEGVLEVGERPWTRGLEIEGEGGEEEENLPKSYD